MAFKLPGAVYSPELLESVAYEIEQYVAWYHQAKVQKEVGTQPQPEPTYSAEAVATIEAWLEGKKPTMEALEALAKHLRELRLPVVHVTMAALPNHEQRTQLVDWFRSSASSQTVLIAFVADRTLGGGVVVRTPNRMFDCSWKQQLIAGQAKLPEIVSRYAR